MTDFAEESWLTRRLEAMIEEYRTEQARLVALVGEDRAMLRKSIFAIYATGRIAIVIEYTEKAAKLLLTNFDNSVKWKLARCDRLGEASTDKRARIVSIQRGMV